MPVLPSYRIHSIDLLCISIGWFLYEGNTGIYWTNMNSVKNKPEVLLKFVCIESLTQRFSVKKVFS